MARRKLFRLLLRRQWLTAALLTVLFLAFWYAVYSTENVHRGRTHLPRIGLFEAFRMVLPPFLGQNADVPPLSPTAQAISIVSLVIGVAMVATVFGRVAALFMERKEKEKMPGDVHDHIVICNWNDRADRIVRELHAPDLVPDITIIVVADCDVNEQELRNSDAYKRVYFVRADPTLHDVLEHGASAHMARSVIVLADDSSPDADANTAMIALAIAKLEQGQTRKPHIVAEVVNPRKIEHLIDAGVDEWVCSADYGLGLIAQAAVNRKIVAVYSELLSHAYNSSELYIVDPSKYPDSLVGRPFAEASQLLGTLQNPENPVILVGLRRGDSIILNPKPDAHERIQDGDGLVVLCYRPPDLRRTSPS